MPRRISHPIDVSLFTGVSQWVLRLGDTLAEYSCPGERPARGAHARRAHAARRRDREPADVGGTPLRRRARWPPSLYARMTQSHSGCPRQQYLLSTEPHQSLIMIEPMKSIPRMSSLLLISVPKIIVCTQPRPLDMAWKVWLSGGRFSIHDSRSRQTACSAFG